MSKSNKDVKFCLKAVINKQKTKVLFAEIDSHFADVLLSFLTLPLGKIVRLLEKHYGDEAPVFRSLTTLYSGLSNLDGAHFWSEGCKQMLLDPASSFTDERRKLKLNIGDTQPTKYFSCENWYCHGYTCIGMYHGHVRCICGKQLKKQVHVRYGSKAADGDGGVFTVSSLSFILSDDLLMLPKTTTSVKQIVGSLGLMGLDGMECRDVTFGFNEIMDLLKFSLLVQSPLTKLILERPTKYEPVEFQIVKTEALDVISLSVKVILQKSTNTLLFVEADENFVDFLFSLLTIPLGKVESLLGGNAGLKNIDNLYRSISCPVDSNYLRNRERTRLIDPTVPHGYLSKNRIFPLCEEGAPKLQYYRRDFPFDEYMYHVSSSGNHFKSPIVEGNYVKGPRKYMVKDDLTVMPLCMNSYISAIKEQKIPLSDLDELVLEIGLQEASGILKAALVSYFALSNGLKHLMTKQPKQEP